MRSRVKLKTLDEATTIAPPTANLALPSSGDGTKFEALNRAIDLGITLIILWQVGLGVLDL